MNTIVTAFSGLSVDDLAKAKSFYGDVMGVVIEDTGSMGLRLHLPGGGMVFVYGKPDHQPATYTLLNFVTNNIDAAVEELSQKGVTFERYEGMHQDDMGIARGLAADRGPDIAWFKDPAGNILAVLQDE